jgi:tetratricopeptide (TPR) repeat protein
MIHSTIPKFIICLSVNQKTDLLEPTTFCALCFSVFLFILCSFKTGKLEVSEIIISSIHPFKFKMRDKARTSKKKRSSKKRNVARNPEASLDEILAAAEAALASLENEKAVKLYSKAAVLLRMGRTISSETRERLLIRVLEKLGESKVALGDQVGAKANFQEAIQLLEQESDKNISHHETRSSLFFYVGQLSMEKEALHAYEQGLTSLELCFNLARQQSPEQMSDVEDATSQKSLHEFRTKLSGGYCAVAELYLTDLCYEENAESECESHLEKALQMKDVDDQPFADALQTIASLRLSQQSKRQEGVRYALRAFDKMKVGCDALASLVGLMEQGGSSAGSTEQASELTELEVEAANGLPEFEFRCQTAKILLECAALFQESACAQEQQCVASAISVLGSLLAQNDEVVEIWFLTGCAFALKNPEMADSAVYYLQRAMEMLEDVRKALEKEAELVDEVERQDIQEELEENKVQMDDVQAKLDELQGCTDITEE